MDEQASRLQALDELLRTAVGVRRHMEEVGRRHGLTASQAQLLMALDQPMRMQAAAEATVCEPSHLTALAEQLEHSGLLLREPDPTDRRARHLVLTSRGVELRVRLLPAVIDGAPVVSRPDPDTCSRLTALLRDKAAPNTSSGKADRHG